MKFGKLPRAILYLGLFAVVVLLGAGYITDNLSSTAATGVGTVALVLVTVI